jgi:Ca-activated chloride channel family protein
MKDAAREFIDARVNDRIGLVTFALYPELRCPLTLDHKAAQRILKSVESVRPRSEEDKTGIGLGLALAARTLRASQAPSKIVVLLSDGQENVLEVMPSDAAKVAKDFGVKVYTIGAGSGERTFFGVQAMDFSELEKVAEITGGKFFRAEDKNALTATYEQIDKLEKTEVRDPRYQMREKYFFALLPAVGLLLTAFCLRSTLFGEVPAA